MTTRRKRNLKESAHGFFSPARREFLKKVARWSFVGSSVLANIKTLVGWPSWGIAVSPAPAPAARALQLGSGVYAVTSSDMVSLSLSERRSA